MAGNLQRRSKKGVKPAVWTLRAEAPRDSTNPNARRQVSTSFKGSREDAEEALHRFVRNVRAGAFTTTSLLTFADLFTVWQEAETVRQKPRAATTAWQDQLRFHRWIEPTFGTTPVTAVLPADIDKFYERLRRTPDAAKGLSANSIVRIHSLLAAMVNWAFRHQLIDKNPMEHVTKPRGEVLAPRAPSVQCVQTLLEHLWESDKRMWLAVRLTSTLGLRRSELLAIKWKDLANVFANEVGHLRIDSGIVADRKTKTLITTDTKSGAQSHRTLWLDEQLTADITEMFRGISLERFSDGYVFSDDEDSSKPWYPDTLNKKLSRARSVVANDISSNNPPITFRSLRIFCASVIFANELDVRTAKAVLGHASLQTTDRYYIAFTDEQLREATVGVGKKLSRTPLSGPRY